jgi:hypothetical protein
MESGYNELGSGSWRAIKQLDFAWYSAELEGLHLVRFIPLVIYNMSSYKLDTLSYSNSAVVVTPKYFALLPCFRCSVSLKERHN